MSEPGAAADPRQSVPRTGTDRLLYRQLRLTDKRPEPPRELGFIGNLLVWRPPQNDANVTHYRLRIDTDAGAPDYEVSRGQNSQELSQGERFYVSSYNQPADLESKRASIRGKLGGLNPPCVASFNVPGTLATGTAQTNPIEFSLPEGYSFRCLSVWMNLLTAGAGDTTADILYSVDDLKAVYTSILAAAGAIGAVRLIFAGSGYTKGDLLTVVQVDGSEGTITVQTVDAGGAILTYTLETGGTGYVTANGVIASGGTGAGATFDIDVAQVTLVAGRVQLATEYRVFTGYPDTYLDLPRRAFLRLDLTEASGAELLVQLQGELVKDRVERGGRSIAGVNRESLPMFYVGTVGG